MRMRQFQDGGTRAGSCQGRQTRSHRRQGYKQPIRGSISASEQPFGGRQTQASQHQSIYSFTLVTSNPLNQPITV